MTTAIAYFLLGVLAAGLVLAPLILKRRTDKPASDAGAGAGAEAQPAAAPQAGPAPNALSARLAALPSWALPAGGAGVVVVAAAALFFATSDKPPEPATDAAASAPAAAAPGAKLPDVDTMIGRLAKRLQEKPNDPEGWKMLGWSYLATQKYPEAVAAYQKAVALNPKDADIHAALGEARTHAAADKVTPEAEADFRRALAIDSGNPRARLYLARKTAQSGDPKGAVETMFQILKTLPADAPQAILARDLIRKMAAEGGIDIASRLPPEPTPAMAAGPASSMPAASAGAMGAAPGGDPSAMIEGMVDRLDARLKADPHNLDGWIMLVKSRKQLGQMDRAKEALNKGLAVFKDDSASRDKLNAAAKSFGVE
jgi:cytochrome c-type biogenesis protein CcmH